MPALNWPLSGDFPQLSHYLPLHTLRFSLVSCARPKLSSLQLEPPLTMSVVTDP